MIKIWEGGLNILKHQQIKSILLFFFLFLNYSSILVISTQITEIQSINKIEIQDVNKNLNNFKTSDYKLDNPNFRDDADSNINLSKEYWAILIGINDYPGTQADLPWSVNEINSFKETLLHGGNWKEEHIKTLTDNKATKTNILNATNWLDSQEDSNDVSIFYFAGHGSSSSENQYLNFYDSTFSDEELKEELDKLEGRLIVILDSCFSGGFIEELKDKTRVILTACGKQNKTYQDSNLKSGFFGYFLNLTLRTFTKTAEMTFIFAYPQIVAYSKKISEEYGEDYSINPKIYDGSLMLTKIIRSHFRIWFKLQKMNSIFQINKKEIEIWEM